MSWIIVGDETHANFAGDTGMWAFGPLHSNYGSGNAKEELRDFAETLEIDPRTLHKSGRLQKMYDDWARRTSPDAPGETRHTV